MLEFSVIMSFNFTLFYANTRTVIHEFKRMYLFCRSCEVDAFLFANACCAVINVAESGISFQLKRRDQLLDYILTLMHRDDDEDFFDSSVELLRTQVCLLCQILFYCQLKVLFHIG